MTYGRSSVVLSLLVLLSMTSCGDAPEALDGATQTTVTLSPLLSATNVVPLADGPLEPGRYRFVVSVDCEGVTDDPIACPEGVVDPPPIALEVTAPAGWEHLQGLPVIRTLGEQTHENGALVLGWTSNTVGVNSDPCSSKSHELPDIKIGPSVDDFVDAVGSQKRLHATAPVATKVGGTSGRYFTLTGAGRPPSVRRVAPVVADYFPGASARTTAQLRHMVESIRFTSN